MRAMPGTASGTAIDPGLQREGAVTFAYHDNAGIGD